jgi:hypothetical protein
MQNAIRRRDFQEGVRSPFFDASIFSAGGAETDAIEL